MRYLSDETQSPQYTNTLLPYRDRRPSLPPYLPTLNDSFVFILMFVYG